MNAEDLTLKTTMLLALLSGQRCQTLHLLLLSGMVLQHDNCVFKINSLLKASRSGKHLPDLVFSAYSPDNRPCPILCLAEYIEEQSG